MEHDTTMSSSRRGRNEKDQAMTAMVKSDTQITNESRYIPYSLSLSLTHTHTQAEHKTYIHAHTHTQA